MKVDLVLGKKDGLALPPSPSAVSMPGQLMRVCERAFGNIRSSPTEWSGF